MAEKAEEWTSLAKSLTFASIGTHRKKIMVTLLDGVPRTPPRISEEAEMYRSHTSKAVKELEGENLVECLTPNRRKGKLFALTEKGERVSSRLSISEGLSGLELKIGKVLDHLSIPYARNIELGPENHKAAADFVVLNNLEPIATITAEALSGNSLRNLRESAFLVGSWKARRENLKSMLVLGGTSKERTLEVAGFFIVGTPSTLPSTRGASNASGGRSWASKSS